MKFYDFLLNEDIDLFKKIEKDCSEIFYIYFKTNRFFYRGMKAPITTLTKKTPRMDRRPTDTDILFHDIADEYFYEKFKWKPRSESVFATSSYKVSEEYASGGSTSIIFPFNGFKYIWSPKIPDAYSELFAKSNAHIEWRRNYYPSVIGNSDGYWINNSGKKVQNLETLDNTTNLEITLSTGKDYLHKITYYWNPDTRKKSEEIWKWVPQVSERDYILSKLEPYLKSYIDKNIGSCLTSHDGNEIMFKCSNYYLLPVSSSTAPYLMFDPVMMRNLKK